MKTPINKLNFYYNEVTKKITNDILDNLEMSISYDQTQYDWPYDLKIDEEEFYYFNFTYSIERIPKKYFIKNDITGTSGLDECCMPHVKINMLLQERKWMKNHNYKFAEIANVVAHELHHLTQDIAYFSIEGVEDKPRHIRENPYVKYFLMPAEIEAYHIGFRAESDLSGKSIEYCIKKYLDNHLNAKNLNKHEYENILVNWLNPKIELLKGAINNES